MTNITIGQRIDVYESLSLAWEGLIERNGIYVGYEDEADFQLYHPKAKDKFDYNNFLLMWDWEVRKCGYYLKVKSLKGGFSE